MITYSMSLHPPSAYDSRSCPPFLAGTPALGTKIIANIAITGYKCKCPNTSAERGVIAIKSKTNKWQILGISVQTCQRTPRANAHPWAHWEASIHLKHTTCATFLNFASSKNCTNTAFCLYFGNAKFAMRPLRLQTSSFEPLRGEPFIKFDS